MELEEGSKSVAAVFETVDLLVHILQHLEEPSDLDAASRVNKKWLHAFQSATQKLAFSRMKGEESEALLESKQLGVYPYQTNDGTAREIVLVKDGVVLKGLVLAVLSSSYEARAARKYTKIAQDFLLERMFRVPQTPLPYYLNQKIRVCSLRGAEFLCALFVDVFGEDADVTARDYFLKEVWPKLTQTHAELTALRGWPNTSQPRTTDLQQRQHPAPQPREAGQDDPPRSTGAPHEDWHKRPLDAEAKDEPSRKKARLGSMDGVADLRFHKGKDEERLDWKGEAGEARHGQSRKGRRKSSSRQLGEKEVSEEPEVKEPEAPAEKPSPPDEPHTVHGDSLRQTCPNTLSAVKQGKEGTSQRSHGKENAPEEELEEGGELRPAKRSEEIGNGEGKSPLTGVGREKEQGTPKLRIEGAGEGSRVGSKGAGVAEFKAGSSSKEGIDMQPSDKWLVTVKHDGDPAEAGLGELAALTPTQRHCEQEQEEFAAWTLRYIHGLRHGYGDTKDIIKRMARMVITEELQNEIPAACEAIPLRALAPIPKDTSDVRATWNAVYMPFVLMLAEGSAKDFQDLVENGTATWSAFGFSTTWKSLMPADVIKMYQQDRNQKHKFVPDHLYHLFKQGRHLSCHAAYPDGLELKGGGRLSHADFLLRQLGPEIANLLCELQPRIKRSSCKKGTFNNTEQLRDAVRQLKNFYVQGRVDELVEDLRRARLMDPNFESRHWERK